MTKKKSTLLLIGKLLCVSLCVSSINISYAARPISDEKAGITSDCPEKQEYSGTCEVTRIPEGHFHIGTQQYCLYKISCPPAYADGDHYSVNKNTHICVTALIKPEDGLRYILGVHYGEKSKNYKEKNPDNVSITQQDVCINSHTNMKGNYCGWVNHDSQLHPYLTEMAVETIEAEHKHAGWTCPAGR